MANRLTWELLGEMQQELPKLNSYILAAMLCEYKGAFENRHQYPGWTIDQEPLLYDKVTAYWGDIPAIDLQAVWRARAALFPAEVLGEIDGKWHGTRWDLTKTLRDFGYNWSDLRYDYIRTLASGNWQVPIATS